MRTYTSLFIALLITTLTFAQQGINYKALIKDDLGNVIANDLIGVQFTILEGISAVYQETQTPTTDANGIMIVNIGEGTPIFGDFSTIEWENGTQYLNVEINIGGGFVDMGNSQFKTVPYALTSGDKSWESEDDNVHVLSKNVGIGTNTPSELLEISDTNEANIKLTVPSTFDATKLIFANGVEGGARSFYKIENRSDQLRFEVNTDFNASTDYENRMTLSNTGLALEDGVRINEFSNDGTLAGNSNSAVPTEGAVKTYVDNAISTSNTISIPASAMGKSPTSTIITDASQGLEWSNSFAASTNIIIKKPDNYNGGDVEFSIFYIVTTSSSGVVQFFIRPRSYNTTDQFADAASVTSTGVFVSPTSGLGTIYKQIITIPAITLTKDLWYISIQRNTESFTEDVTVMSAALAY